MTGWLKNSQDNRRLLSGQKDGRVGAVEILRRILAFVFLISLLYCNAHAQFELPSNRSVFDAFCYQNRIPTEPNEQWQEGPIDLAGRIYSRLANQEGRVILKLPREMTEADYLSFKTFFSFDASFFYERVGNCVACHALPAFTDSKPHVVVAGAAAIETPSLRNVMRTDQEIRAAIMQHIAARDQPIAGSVDDVDEQLKRMNITAEDVPGLIRFVRELSDLKITDKEFEKVIQDARTVDVRPE